jgi:hypothetical protein
VAQDQIEMARGKETRDSFNRRMAETHPLYQGRIELLDLLSSDGQHLSRKIQEADAVA